jgi:hypothetical protein
LSQSSNHSAYDAQYFSNVEQTYGLSNLGLELPVTISHALSQEVTNTCPVSTGLEAQSCAPPLCDVSHAERDICFDSISPLALGLCCDNRAANGNDDLHGTTHSSQGDDFELLEIVVQSCPLEEPSHINECTTFVGGEEAMHMGNSMFMDIALRRDLDGVSVGDSSGLMENLHTSLMAPELSLVKGLNSIVEEEAISPCLAHKPTVTFMLGGARACCHVCYGNLHFDMLYCLKGIHLIWSIVHGKELKFLSACHVLVLSRMGIG